VSLAETPRIDVHTHVFPSQYMKALTRLRDDASPAGDRIRLTLDHPYMRDDLMFFERLDERIGMMDDAGVETHVLSFSSPNIWHPDADVKRELCRAFNDGCLEIAAAHPGRFRLLGLMPLPFVSETLAEAERLGSTPDVVGVGISAYTAGMPIDDHRLAPVFADWNRRGWPVFVHPDPFPVPNLLEDYGMNWSIGAPVEDLIVAVRLMQSGMLDKYDRISWVVPHLGGALPFLLARLDKVWETLRSADDPETRRPSERLGRIHVDAATLSPGSLRLTAEVLGHERVLFASDFPFVSREDLRISRGVVEAAIPDPRQRAAILGGNARRLELG
jgi:6-methylsalicylate decarboxylase